MWNNFLEMWRSLSREQRIAVLVLGVCGFFALSLSVYRVRANVIEPFLVDKESIQRTKVIIGTTPQEEEDRLKRSDTDGDGVSDWNEINVARTNPNLRDTCGDGIPDNVRILTGQNINCSGTAPSGEVNLSALAEQGLGDTGTNALFAQPSVTATSGGSIVGMEQSSTDVPMAGSLDASTFLPRNAALIREALKETVDPVKLQTLSDEELLKYYDEAISIRLGEKTLEEPTFATSNSL